MTHDKKMGGAIHRVVVDRLDGDVATIVYGARTFTWPRALLPRGTKEGDALRVSFERDDDATEEMKREVQSRLDRLRENDDGGDESL